MRAGLSRCGWKALKVFYTTHVSDPKAVPGAVVAIQTFGDFPQGFHPHLHILVSDPPRWMGDPAQAAPDSQRLSALYSEKR